MELVQTIPGVQAKAAATIVAEIGIDMSRFPSAKHLASWAGLCPGNKQSGGKRLSGKTTKGNTYLRGVLAEVAWSLSRMRTKYLAAQYHRLARRLGKKKASVAVAHSLLVIIYHILRTKKPYSDLGGDYFDRLDAERIQRHHVASPGTAGIHGYPDTQGGCLIHWERRRIFVGKKSHARNWCWCWRRKARQVFLLHRMMISEIPSYHV